MAARAICGVYAIVNTNTGKWYVGSSNHVKSRLNMHFSMLRRGVHHSPKLQASFNKHGEGAFERRVLAEAARERLAELEQLVMDAASSVSDGYNILPNARSSVGRRLSDAAKKRLSDLKRGVPKSEQTKQRIRDAAAARGISAETRERMSAAQRGKKASPETRQRMSTAHKSRANTEKGLLHMRQLNFKANVARWGAKELRCST